MTRALFALVVLLAGCAATPRAVAPLRYDEAVAPAADDAALATPPEVATDGVPSFTVQEATLAGGLRVVVVPRRGHTVLAARLFFPHDVADVGDVGGMHTSLIVPVFFPSNEMTGDASVQCGSVGCSIAIQGAAQRLDGMLDEIAGLGAHPPQDAAALARRFAAATRTNTAYHPALGLYRNAMRALYEATPYAAWGPTTGTLPELLALRDRLFDPAGATLVVAGDTSLDAVRPLAEARFGSWPARAPAARPRAPLAPLRPGAVVAVQNGSLAQVHAQIAARAAAPGSRDDYALWIALGLVVTAKDSPGFVHVREELGASYGVSSSRLLSTRDASAVAIGGSFEKEKTVQGLGALLAAIRALRAAPPDENAVARARTYAISQWRQLLSTNAGVAMAVSGQALIGQPLRPDEVPAQMASVTGQDVQRVARTLLADENLRVVLVGDVRALNADLRALGLGSYVSRDGFGRD